MPHRLHRSLLLASLVISCAGCTSVLRKPAAEVVDGAVGPKVKYDAPWWSDKADDKSVQSILDRRKEAMAEHAKQSAAISDEDKASPHPPALPDPTPQRSRDEPVPDEFAVRAIQHNYGSSQTLQASWVEPPALPEEFPTRAEGTVANTNNLRERVDSPVRLNRAGPSSASHAIRIRAIVEDARGESIAVLGFADGGSLQVRENDRVDIPSDGAIIEMRVARIGTAAVYLEREDNKEVRIVR